MPLNLGSLVQTASGALEHSRRRKQEERERAAQQETAILQRSLLQAQIDKLRAPPEAKPPTPVGWETRERRDGTFIQVNPQTGETRPVLADGAPVQAPERRDPNAPTLGVEKVPEREKGTFGNLALQANETINRLEARDPTIGARVAQRLANTRGIIAALGHRIAGMSQDEIDRQAETRVQASMSPDELEYYHATGAFMGQVLPGRSGKAVTGREWLMQSPAFIATGQVTPQTTAARRQLRYGAVRGLYREAGPAAEAALAEIRGLGIDLTPYGFGAPVPQPQSLETPQTPGYNPRFWRPRGRP